MKKNKEPSHLITQYAASKIPGMPSRQNFNTMFHDNKSMYNFFTANGKIDTTHPDWKQYIEDRKNKTWGIKSAEKKAVGVSERKSEDGTGKKKADGKADEKESGKISQYILNMRGGRKFTGRLRQAILERDNFRCVRCGKSSRDGVILEVDHIIEFEDGGETSFDNGQTLCPECNKGKSLTKDITQDEFITFTEFGRRVNSNRNNVARAIKDGIIECDNITSKINYTTEIIKWFKSNNNDNDNENKESGWRREHALTGGYNPAGFYPNNPGQLKAMTEVTRMNLEMRIKLQEYIQKDIVDSYIDRIAQGINQFVNLGRTVSNPICAKLDRMGMEKEVEKIIGGKVKGIIEQIILTCNGIAGKDYGSEKLEKGKAKKKKNIVKKKKEVEKVNAQT